MSKRTPGGIRAIGGKLIEGGSAFDGPIGPRTVCPVSILGAAEGSRLGKRIRGSNLHENGLPTSTIPFSPLDTRPLTIPDVNRSLLTYCMCRECSAVCLRRICRTPGTPVFRYVLLVRAFPEVHKFCNFGETDADSSTQYVGYDVNLCAL